MGTRSTTTIYEGDTPLVTFYRQYDGYPSGHGAELAAYLDGAEIGNGIPGSGYAPKFFNGAGDLAFRLIAHFKPHDVPGSFYIVPTSHTDEEYNYRVYVVVGEPVLIAMDSDVPVKVTPAEFLAALVDA